MKNNNLDSRFFEAGMDGCPSFFDDLLETNKKELTPTIAEFKAIVNDIFTKYGKSEDNILILSECFGNRGWDIVGPGGEAFTKFSVIKFSENNKWAKSVKLPHTTDYDKINTYYKKLWHLMELLGIPHADEIFGGDDEITPDMHGFIAVRKNYEVIAFICSTDNVMSDEDYFDANCVINNF